MHAAVSESAVNWRRSVGCASADTTKRTARSPWLAYPYHPTTQFEKCDSRREAWPKRLQMSVMGSVRVVDFFSGCGVTSAGRRRAGIEIVLGIDQSEHALEALQANFLAAGFNFRDIRRILTWGLERRIVRVRERPLPYSAYVPRQPFSKQNKRRSESNARATLQDELNRIVRRFRREYFCVENVTSIQRISPSSETTCRFLNSFFELVYCTARDLVDFLDLGLPQTRLRSVMIASMIGEDSLPTAARGAEDGLQPHSTAWEWIGDMPPRRADGRDVGIRKPQAAALSLRRNSNTPQGGDSRDRPVQPVLACLEGHMGHTDVYVRLSRDSPASTHATKCISRLSGRFDQPTQDRARTVKEAARMQNFLRGFALGGSIASMAMLTGNAVPVKLICKLGANTNEHADSFVQLASA